MYCRNCKKELPEEAVACIGCGMSPKKGSSYCSSCGESTKHEQIICTKCGISIKEIPSEEGIYKSSDDAQIGGVCAGLAHKYKINKNMFRVITLLISLFLSGFPVILYLIAWAVFPKRETLN
jgi:phage shock protein PspC (stress-responsive transcriptional regulator)